MRDITEQKRVDKELRNSERQLADFFEHATVGLHWVGPDGIILRVNVAELELLGYAPSEYVGHHISEFHVNEEVIGDILARQTRDESLCDYEARLRCKDGSIRTVLINSNVFRVDGVFVHTRCFTRDITDRKRAEDAVRDSESRYRGLVENAPYCIHELDAIGRFVSMNPAGLRMMGVEEPACVIGIHYLDSVSVADRPRVAELLHSAGAGVASAFEFTSANGQFFSSNFVPVADGKVMGITQDITDRKRAEDAVQTSQRILRTVLDNIPQGVFWKDRESRYVGCNRVVARAFGIDPPERLIGKTDREFPGVNPEEAEFFLRKDREVMESDTPISGLVEPATLADGSAVWLETNKVPMHDPEGRVIGLLGTWQDITERKRADEKILAALHEKDALLKEVHHRVKNNLQVISSLLNLQAERITEPAVRAVFVESQSRVRAMALVHETLYRSESFARIDLLRYFESLCDSLLRTFGGADRVTLERRVAATDLDLDRALPCGLIVNELVSNALKYAFPEGRSGRLVVSFDLVPGVGYTLVVRDDGVGLPASIDLAGSRSLGLHLVTILARQLRGRLDIDRSGGTRFTITFPV